MLLLATIVGCRAPQTSTVEQARQRDQELVAFNSWVERGWSSASWVPPGSAPDDYTRQQFRQQADQLVKR
ncbi:hypothetical protein J0H58_00175 [bacterium]|nr:hypothetical protein [bacterium]